MYHVHGPRGFVSFSFKTDGVVVFGFEPQNLGGKARHH